MNDTSQSVKSRISYGWSEFLFELLLYSQRYKMDVLIWCFWASKCKEQSYLHNFRKFDEIEIFMILREIVPWSSMGWLLSYKNVDLRKHSQSARDARSNLQVSASKLIKI